MVRSVLFLMLGLTSILLGDVSFRSVNDWNWHGSVPRGRAVEIRGITGDIKAIAGDGKEVEIFARFQSGAEASKPRMKVSETSAGVAVCSVPAGGDACATDPLTGSGARVDYFVKLPAGVQLIARTVNGNIEAEGLGSDVIAKTVNGGVDISTSGTAQAHTVNGSIRAFLSRPFWRRSSTFSAVNGGIKVRIPTGVRADVHAETKNGAVVSNLKNFRGASTEQELNGRVGAPGGAASGLTIRTINGTVELNQPF